MNKPANVIVILLDSLNRHMLGAYGGREFETPNLDRFAQRAMCFDKHFTGSLPCMPARHDILCGALDFLWKPWGSIELWEDAITYHLRLKGIKTMLASDHPHLFEAGGENYHTDFSAWEYLRGHEGDPWKTRPDPSWSGAPALPAATGPMLRHYDESRTWFREEGDFPGPKTMKATADWLHSNAGHHDRFMLFVDEFDPHEPFDTPEPWASKYDPDWDKDRIIWPPYKDGAIKDGDITAREGRQIRANYGAKLSMIDHWFGKVLDVIDEKNLWDDTLIVLCTDHGHYLGEKDIWGKPRVMQYETLGHTPLMMAAPGVTPGRTNALTTNVDIFATMADVFDIEVEHRTHGHSLYPLLTGEKNSVREWAIGGIFGNWVQIQDGKHKYARAPAKDGFPLSMWSNRWSTMPISALPKIRLPRPDSRAQLDFMPGSDVPVIRQPFQEGDLMPFWCYKPPVGEHQLFNIEDDPEENENLVGQAAEKRMKEMLHEALKQVEAPAEQFERLGLG